MGADRACFDVPLRRDHVALRVLRGVAGLAAAGYCFWLAIAPSGQVQEANFGTLMIALIGVAAAGVGLHSLVLGWWQVRHPSPGLRVDMHGILDNSRGDGGRMLAWDDIDDFESARDEDNIAFLYAFRQGPAPDHTVVPAALIGDGVVRWKIDSANLAIDHDELHRILRRHLAQHRQRRDARA